MSLAHNPRIVTDGLIVCLDAANPKSYPGSGTTATDIANQKTLNFTSGVDYLPDNKGCFYFNASGELGSIIGAHSGITNSTWEAWINLEESTNAYNMFMGNYPPYFSMINSGTRFMFSIITGGAQRTISGIADKLTNTWYNPVVTLNYDGVNTNAKLYVNGSIENTVVWSGAPSYSTTFTIGEGRTTAWYPFKGKIASAKLYNKTLTDDEVLQNYNALKGRYGL